MSAPINFKLIKFVKTYPMLYKQNHVQYKNNSLRKIIWDMIGAKLYLTGDEAKLKWKYLRDTYVRQLKRLYYSEQTQNRKQIYWLYSDEMSFMREYITCVPRAFPQTQRKRKPKSNPSKSKSAQPPTLRVVNVITDQQLVTCNKSNLYTDMIDVEQETQELFQMMPHGSQCENAFTFQPPYAGPTSASQSAQQTSHPLKNDVLLSKNVPIEDISDVLQLY